MRELTFARVMHPEFIDNEWVRVDHPVTDPIQDGAPDLGWEGDSRLVVYLHKPTQRFVLWRLEHDGEYRPTARLPEGASITPGSVNELIRNLVRIDQRRGFDPGLDVVTKENARIVAQDKTRREWAADFADKFHAALAWSHLPGVHHTRLRQARRKG